MPVSDSGDFVRKPTTFRYHVTAEGGRYPAAADRYHLYVSYACPWAHRALITRVLKGLEHVVTVDVVDHFMPERGWTLQRLSPGATGDTVNGFTELRQVYFACRSDFAGRFTVPVLYDKHERCIVNNESSEIIRMFDGEFQALARHPEVRLYPEDLRDQIDALNEWIYPQINNGVYKCGFARSQEAYERAVGPLFEGLERVESILSRNRYLTGDQFTEADVRLFTTLLRFDLVYYTHFKCNVRRLVDFPATWAYTRELYQMPAIRGTVDFFHIKNHYYESHTSINPYGIVPAGPELDFLEPHGRGA